MACHRRDRLLVLVRVVVIASSCRVRCLDVVIANGRDYLLQHVGEFLSYEQEVNVVGQAPHLLCGRCRVRGGHFCRRLCRLFCPGHRDVCLLLHVLGLGFPRPVDRRGSLVATLCGWLDVYV